MLVLTGAVTIFPLFFFNLGLKYISLGLAGVLFYIAPSFHFITSIFILNENLSFPKLISFIIIWIAIAVFIYDIFKENKNLVNYFAGLLNRPRGLLNRLFSLNLYLIGTRTKFTKSPSWFRKFCGRFSKFLRGCPSELPSVEVPVSYTHLTLPTTPYV